MAVSVRDSRLVRDDRRWIESVYREYVNDLSPSSTGLFPALSEIGHREPDQLATWFGDSSAHVFTIVNDNRPAGFALVRRQGAAARGGSEYSMAEFFISRTLRRRGIGQEAVRLIFDRFAGPWHIMEYLRNPEAVAFWRRVVSAYTGGRYQERAMNGETHQYFDTAAARNR